MRRRLIGFLASAALAAFMVPATVAAGAPIGGCPTGADWQIVLPIHQPQLADKNGDGYLCRLFINGELGGRLGGGFTFRDNNVP
jgi:hypothetical protein